MWIFMARAHLGTDCTYLEAEAKNPRPCVRDLVDLAGALPNEERDKLREGLRIAEEVLEVRNAVVHGVLLPNADGTELESQRPDVKQRKDPHHEWKRVRLSRVSLLEAEKRAEEVSGLLQANLMRWQGMLGLDDEGDD